MNSPNQYFIYITTNQHRTVLYTGMTNDLERRQAEHQFDAVYKGSGFTGKTQSFYVIYYEVFSTPAAAIAREKQIKKWSRGKKIDLINTMNPEWRFLNDEW